MKRRLIHKGLHVIDHKLEDETLISYLTSALRLGREVPSLHEILAERRGKSRGEFVNNPKFAQEIDEEEQHLVAKWLKGNKVDIPNETKLYILELKSCIDQSDEIGALLKDLSGEYLLTKLDGDPISTP